MALGDNLGAHARGSDDGASEAEIDVAPWVQVINPRRGPARRRTRTASGRRRTRLGPGVTDRRRGVSIELRKR